MDFKIFSSLITDENWRDIIVRFLARNTDGSTEADKIFGYLTAQTKQGKVIYPAVNDVFAAFNECPYKDLRVVILGQDPYHNGSADGLAFSTRRAKCPPSLENIFKEIEQEFKTDLTYKFFKGDYSLKYIANQGVLLLNTALTVEAEKPESHAAIWRNFTSYIINWINLYCPGVIFVLWGNHAKEYQHKINEKSHLILTSGHPSPLSANKGLWFGHNHFITINKELVKANGNQISWN